MSSAISFTSYVYKGHFFVQDSEGYIYNDDSPMSIRLKACGFILITPIAIALRIIINLGILLTCSLVLALQVLVRMVTPKEAWISIKECSYEVAHVFNCGKLMEKAAIYTLQEPDRGRRYFAKHERHLNHDEGAYNPNKMYLAKCFQPLVHIDQKGRDDKLERYHSKFPPTRFCRCFFQRTQ